MPKIQFKDFTFQAASRAIIDTCNSIIEDYNTQGLRLTLRQLYYQLVTKNIVVNSEKSYNTLSTIVSRGRLAGLIDWNAIEDRSRTPYIPTDFANLKELVQAALHSYRLPRWEGQKCYAELWVEKDALAGVLSPMAREFHVPLMVNRGYLSQTMMYESSLRFIEHEGMPGIIFYLGDHDPSGEDMVRDIRDRMEMFGVSDLDVQKIALNIEQVRRFKLPPNPAKMADPRASAYIEKYGRESWEVDALPPVTLQKIIRRCFEAVIDYEAMEQVKEQEEIDKKKLLKAVSK